MNIISIYGDEILRLCIGILTIVIITNYLKSVNIIFDSRVHLKNIDTIKSSENVSDKLDELGYKYRWSLLILSISSIVLYVLYSLINLPISDITIFLILIMPSIFLILLSEFKHPKYAKIFKISKYISVLVFMGFVWISIKYYQYSSISNILLYFCYVGGLFIAIAYYWNDLIYEFGKFHCVIQFLLRMTNNIYYFNPFKNYVIENYNHRKDEDIEVNDKTDCFGTLNKINMIEEGFKNQILNNHKIIALYGNWGSGKSSIIRTLIEKFDESRNFDENTEIKRLWESFKDMFHIFKPLKEKHKSILCIKFDAWEYENEENISYALLCHIVNELEKNADIKFGIRTVKNKLLKSGAIVLKSVSINTEYNNIGFNFNFEYNNEKYIEVENLKNGLDEISRILKENNKRLIVFIDELDRCERENILKFLSSLKLFFTDGENINYICAVDKEAVAEALEHKYCDGEKAEEYLEKIFNFSFNMPKTFDVKNFIGQYEFFNNDNAEKLAKFFEAINFTTPRHLKKVLNKYEYLVKIKNSNINNMDLIPGIITGNNDNNEYLFDTIFVLYFIILYEFYYDKYLEIKNYEDKLAKYSKYQIKYINYPPASGKDDNENDNKPAIELIMERLKHDSYNEITFGEIYESIIFNEPYFEKIDDLIKLITIFTPSELKNKQCYITYAGYSDVVFDYISQFKYEKNEILIDFCRFLVDEYSSGGHPPQILNYNGYERNYTYKYINLFKMAETLL